MADSAQPELMDEDEPFLSNLDIFLFSLIAGLIVYWLIFRKKVEPIPEFKKLESVIINASVLLETVIVFSGCRSCC
uniref:Uncharacterized protein n=1 Tax=Cyprinus carpio TaxID=7962 RepID=A0A8C2FGK1_CYPCA